ncbi:MAG: glycosyltransferase [Fervidobacterium pennivorans]
MSDKKRCLLSVAMIMKNEEHNLDRALGSIKPYVDEIVVVDTGSTDNSVEIAKKYTDKVYFHEWRNDFSEARNYSLQFPTCEWVLIFDADEEVKEDFAGIRDFLRNLPKDVNTVYLPTLSYLDWDLKKTEITSSARIFRNGTVRYENIVHNQPIYKGRVVEAPFTIYHYGYIWTRKLRKRKYERTRNLIIKHLKDKNNMVLQEKIYYLCQLYKTELIGENKLEANRVLYEIIQEVKNTNQLPSIALEVLFLYSLELSNKGFTNEAKKILTDLLELAPKNPDAYYGLTVAEYLEKNYEKVIKYGEQFLERIEYAETNPQEFPWTIISIKYKPIARAFIAESYLRTGNLDGFKRHASFVLDKSKLTQDEILKLSFVMISAILELNDDKFSHVTKELEYFLRGLSELRISVDVLDVVEKVLTSGVEFDWDVLKPFMLGNFSELILRRINEKSDLLFEYIFGTNQDEWSTQIENMGVEGLLFFYEHVPNDEPWKLKVLNKLKSSTNTVLKGIVHGLIGDVFLKRGDFRLAISYYRDSVEILPELSRFIKPIIEDLKTKLDTDIEGVYAELKDFYLSNKEMMIDTLSNYRRNEVEKLYLISDSDFAKYVSAVFLAPTKPEKARKLLEDVKKWEDFPFIEYRYAKLIERSETPEELRKAYSYHMKALWKNPALGDISLGKFKYDNFYPFETIGKSTDEIVWVGNISEKYSGLGIISPVRAWRKAENYLYVEPFPIDEAIKIYKQRAKEFRLPMLEVRKEDVARVLYESGFEKLKVLEDEESYTKLVKELAKEVGIEWDENSHTVISFELVNLAKDFPQVVKNFESGILFYYVPDFDNHDDIIWYYPIFRFIRTKKQVEEELKKTGARKFKHYVLNNLLRAVVFER